MGVFRGRLFFATATVLAAVAFAAEPGLARSVNISSAWLLPRNDFPVFYRHFRDRVTWFEADAVCQFHHAQLATVESNNQFEAIHGYLKELDVTENVWIGLKRNSEASEFTWTNYQPLARGGYFREQVPRSSDPVCVVADPTANFKWHSLHCGGPEVASFVCELPVPYWASKSNGCMTSTMEGMTVTFLPESPAIQLTKECYPGYSRNVTCKGNMKPSEIMEKLSCAGSNKLLKTFKPLKAILPDVKSTTTTTSSSAESDLEDYAIEMATISQYNDETFQSISKAMGRGSGGLVNMPQEMSVALEPIKSSGRGGYDANGIDSAYVGGVAEATTVGAAVTSADVEVATATGTSAAAGKTVGAAAAVAKTTRGPTPKSAVDPATVATTKAAVTFTATTVVVPVATATVTAATTTAAAGPGKSTLTQTTSTAKAPAGTAAEKTSTLATSESRPTTTVTTTTFAVADGHHHHHHRRPSAGAPTAEKVRTVVATATPTTVVTPTVVTAAIVHHQYVDDVTARVPTTGSERRDPTPVAGTPRRVYKKIDLPVVPQPNYEAKPVAATATAAIAGTPATIAGTPATIAGKPATIAGTPATIAGKLAVIAKQLTPPATVANTVTSQTATAPTVGGPPDDDNSTVAAASEASDDKNSSPTSPSSSSSPSTSPTAEVPTAEVATVAEVANGTVITKTVATDATSAAAATDVTTTPASVATATAAAAANNPHRKMKNYDAFTEHPNRSRHIGRPKQQQHHHTYPYILYRLLG